MGFLLVPAHSCRPCFRTAQSFISSKQSVTRSAINRRCRRCDWKNLRPLQNDRKNAQNAARNWLASSPSLLSSCCAIRNTTQLQRHRRRLAFDKRKSGVKIGIRRLLF